MRNCLSFLVERHTSHWQRCVSNRFNHDIGINCDILLRIIFHCPLIVGLTFKFLRLENHGLYLVTFLIDFDLLRAQQESKNELPVSIIQNVLVMLFVLDRSEVFQKELCSSSDCSRIIGVHFQITCLCHGVLHLVFHHIQL